MTVIITDHHNLLETADKEAVLPQADAILNPKQPDCAYPYKCLCGAAIAYKLVTALLHFYDVPGKTSYQEELLAYTAIATVCDVMELTDENRIIVRYGLKQLKNTANKGLLALIDLCQIDKEQLSAFHLGYIIGPCLNASGRLNTAKKGLELLLAQSEEEAVSLAREVKELNDVRKEMTADNAEKAIRLIEDGNLNLDKILVVYLPDCHESIAGIIAGRVKERYNKPAIVLTDAKDCIKGSARSIEQYNMIEELSKCRDLLLKVGGHPMAAGLSLQPENVELLRKRLNENTVLTEEMLIPKVVIDIQLPLGFLSEQLINELKSLEPHGKGNERPLFAEKDLKIKSAFTIGKNSNGIRFRVENQYKKEMDALYFGDVEAFFRYIRETYGSEEAEKLKTGRSLKNTLTVTYTPRINEYNGFKNIQLMIQNYR
jgi:single-stranded-DNA-specific exonuclease